MENSLTIADKFLTGRKDTTILTVKNDKVDFSKPVSTIKKIMEYIRFVRANVIYPSMVQSDAVDKLAKELTDF
jgi:hypothetical protein